MPVVNIIRKDLFEKLGKSFTDEQFDEVCFEFGIELDEVTSDREAAHRNNPDLKADALSKYSDEPMYKIEIPANRYDLLCVEGLSRALGVFLGLRKPASWSTKSAVHEIRVKSESLKGIRPFVVAAVLRGVKMDQRTYDSLIDFQDKLHFTLCRKRTLVAIGTHDLSTVKGPFTYAGESPSSISFRPLFQDKVFSGPELDELYGKDVRFGPYMAIINKGPRWPLIRDSAGTVLSMPPVINGFHSRLTLETRDVLIECTGTDLTKCHWVLNTIASSFAEACEAPFVVEQVKIVYEAGGEGKDEVTPNLGVRVIKVPGDVIVQGTGIPKEKLSVPDMARLLTRMQLPSVPTADGLAVEVTVPAVRTDILHAADIIEDVAIAYGFNKIESRLPTCLTIGTPQPISELTDHIRASMAMAGFTEAVTLVLCSKPECFADLRVSPAEPGPADAALIANPRTNEFEVARTTLLAGMLKTLAHNKATALPLKLFEVADVVVPSPGSETLFRNERRLCASYLNSTGGGFEIIHGLVDRFFQVLGVHVHNKSLAINKYKHGSRGSLSYEIEDGAHPSYFPGRCAKVVLYRKEADKEQEVKTDLGFFGLIHPEVLEKFDIALPAAVVEINVEPFLL